MKRLLLTLVAILSMVNMYATGYETIGGLRYLIDTDAKTATLVASDGEKYSGEIVVPEKVKLAGIEYPVVAIGDNCFKECRTLTSISLPSSIKILGSYCFTSCTSLTTIKIPSSVTSLGEECFSYCYSLESVNIPSSVTNLGDRCFYACDSLKNVSIPTSVTRIGSYCFYNCTSLKSIVFPPSLTNLEWGICYLCKSLKTISIPSTITSIGTNCFSECSSLTSIILPSSIKELQISCMENCTKLDTVFCYAETPPYNSNTGLLNTTIIYVPASSVNKYKQAEGWKDFIAILPIPGTEGDSKGKCDKPTISFANGKLHFESGTAGANYHYTLTCNDVATDAYSEDGDVNLNASYNITAYATADGYSTSDNATATLYWVDGRIDGDATGITATAAKRGIVVSTQNGNVTLSGLNDGEKVSFYSVNGSNLGAVTAKGNTATNSFATGQIVIAKVGNTSIKIAL